MESYLQDRRKITLRFYTQHNCHSCMKAWFSGITKPQMFCLTNTLKAVLPEILKGTEKSKRCYKRHREKVI